MTVEEYGVQRDTGLQELARRRAESLEAGGEAAIARQHERGKLTAYERLAVLFDEGTFQELDPFVTHRATRFGLASRRPPGDAIVTGHGLINGRTVFAYAQDFTVFGGSLSEVVAEKIVKVQDMSMKVGAPIVALQDGGGARIQEGVSSLRGYGDIFLRNTLASGVVPQISVSCGPTAGGGVYSPAITDFVFMESGSGQMYITGPDVVRTVTHEDVTHEELGGAQAHATKSGVAHFAIDGEESTLFAVRDLLSYLPSNNMETPPWVLPRDDPDRSTPEFAELVPSAPDEPYDIRDVMRGLVDDGDLMEVHEHWARNIAVGFARMGGYTVGLVGNSPNVLAGVLDIDASRKAARFVRFCDCFNIPLVTLIDVPGYLPGTVQEHGGIITHGAKLIYAYAEATVPKIAVTLRKAYGGAYVVMSSKHLRSDINLAWPNAEIAVMGAEGAVNIIQRRQIAAAEDPEAERQRLIAEYEAEFKNPYQAAELGYIDDVIDPKDTRRRVIRSLEMLKNKSDQSPPKKHGNIPL
ncbi:MAG: propionyl-CoA carboxylase beta chain [Chloroflexi bacterium]|jgi:propionyl-CoA carboxylase beta chain|nr:MAG: propionyl-CoA carboxylase beta chain [Chloroflexota bacterium]